MGDTKVTPALNTEQRKAVVCRNFQRFGKCNYGDKCNFLHVQQATAMLAMAPLDEDEMNMITMQEHINQTGFEASREVARQATIDALPDEDWTKENT